MNRVESKTVEKKNLFDHVLDVSVYIIFGLVIFSWFSVCAEVICRYFLRQPIIWVVEVTEYIIVHITFLGGAWLLRSEGHVAVDVITSRFSKKNQALILMITSAVSLAMFLLVTWFGAVATWGAFRENLHIPKQLGMPKFAVMLVIPIGSLLLAGQFLRRTFSAHSTWKSLRNGNDDREES